MSNFLHCPKSKILSTGVGGRVSVVFRREGLQSASVLVETVWVLLWIFPLDRIFWPVGKSFFLTLPLTALRAQARTLSARKPTLLDSYPVIQLLSALF